MAQTLETAREAIKLYAELSSHDDKLRAMMAERTGGTPLQKVTFYKWTCTYSGPDDYTPRHKADAIVRNIIADMKIERAKITKHLAEMGFTVPAFEPDNR